MFCKSKPNNRMIHRGPIKNHSRLLCCVYAEKIENTGFRFLYAKKATTLSNQHSNNQPPKQESLRNILHNYASFK